MLNWCRLNSHRSQPPQLVVRMYPSQNCTANWSGRTCWTFRTMSIWLKLVNFVCFSVFENYNSFYRDKFAIIVIQTIQSEPIPPNTPSTERSDGGKVHPCLVVTSTMKSTWPSIWDKSSTLPMFSSKWATRHGLVFGCWNDHATTARRTLRGNILPTLPPIVFNTLASYRCSLLPKMIPLFVRPNSPSWSHLKVVR